jgi:hypothetical protein
MTYSGNGAAEMTLQLLRKDKGMGVSARVEVGLDYPRRQSLAHLTYNWIIGFLSGNLPKDEAGKNRYEGAQHEARPQCRGIPLDSPKISFGQPYKLSPHGDPANALFFLRCCAVETGSDDLVVVGLGFHGKVVCWEKVETFQFLDINGLGHNLCRKV